MAIRIQLRHDTSANWELNNPTLREGEFGIETDTLKIKVGPVPVTGDATAWSDITNYVNLVPSDFNTIINGYVEANDIGAAGGVVGLNNSKNAIIPGSSIIIEGPTNDSYETTLTVTDPTADRTLTLPDATGTLATQGYVDDAISAFDALPTQTGNSGKYLQTDGSTTSWSTVDLSQAVSFDGTETLTNKTLIDPVIKHQIITNASITMFDNVQYAFRKPDGTYYIGPNGQNEWFGTWSTNPLLISSIPLATHVRILNNYWQQVGIFTFQEAHDAGYLIYDDGFAEYTVSPVELYYLDGVSSNIQNQINTKASLTNLSTHASATNVHGVSGAIVGTNNTQTLLNKTLTNPTIFVHEVQSPSSITMTYANGAYVYGFYKADGSYYIGPNGQNEWYGSENPHTVLVADVPLATHVRILSSMWNLIGHYTLAQAESLGYITNNAEVAIDTTISNIEVKYLDGVSSNIQDQLDDKAPIASPTFTGTAIVDDLEIGGALTFSGTATQINQTDLTISDPLIYLADGNTANINDLGFVANFTDGTYQHTGLVRDSSEGVWKLFKGVTDEPTNTVNFGQGSLDDLKVAGLTATSITVGSVSNTEIGYLDGVTSGIQSQLNGKQDVVSGVSSTEIGYLDGVTSKIQDQLDTKVSLSGEETLTNKTLESPTITATTQTQSVVYRNVGGSLDYGSWDGSLTFSVGGSGYGAYYPTDIYGQSATVTNKAATGQFGLVGTSGTVTFTYDADAHYWDATFVATSLTSQEQSDLTNYWVGQEAGTQTIINFNTGTTETSTSTVTVSSTEIKYLAGVTSGIQSQLNSKSTASKTETLTNKTISGSSNTISNIGNSSLSHSSITINGSEVSLGGSTTIDALPSQLGENGKYLTTDGTSASWASLVVPIVTGTATVSQDTATTIDTTSISTFTSIEYMVSLKQGSKIRTSKVLVQTDGSSIDMTEFAIMETGGTMSGVAITATTVSTNCGLKVTVTDASSTNVTVKFSKVAL